MAQKSGVVMFQKYEKTGFRGRWYPTIRFTLNDFMKENAHDEYVIEEFFPKFKALKVGESFVYNGGAGGLDKFKRLPSSTRRKRRRSTKRR